MKKNILFFLLIAAASLTAQNAPQIAAKLTHYDFGQVREGEIVKYSFEVENRGDSDLKIKRVDASCGCTVAKLEKNNLKPGEKTTIKVEFNSENRLGPQEKFISVFSNDPKTPVFKFTLAGVVLDKNAPMPSKDGKNPKLKLNKTEHNFGTVEEGKIVDVTIEFKNEGNGVLEINDIKTSCGCTAALLSSKTLNPGETGSVRINLDTANREGKLTRTVTLFTNDTSQPNHVITLFANVERKK